VTAAPTYPSPLVATTINSSTLVQLGSPGTHDNLAEFCKERPSSDSSSVISIGKTADIDRSTGRLEYRSWTKKLES